MAENETGLTRRGLLKKGAVIGAAAWATPVVQVIGMRPALAQTVSPPDDVCVPDNWAVAFNALETDQGVQADGGAIPANRSDPNNALGAPNATFFSLGFNPGGPGGVIVVQLGAPALQSTGAQLVIVETTTGPYPQELANVEVSADGISWTDAGTASNVAGGNTVQMGTQFWTTLPLPIPVVEFVRITDATNAALFGGALMDTADAFDVNAVGTNCPIV